MHLLMLMLEGRHAEADVGSLCTGFTQHRNRLLSVWKLHRRLYFSCHYQMTFNPSTAARARSRLSRGNPNNFHTFLSALRQYPPR